MNGNKVRLGVVGAGIWGTMHARAYSQHPSAELVAVCDLDGERARELAAAHGVERSFTNFEEMLDLDLDGVSVATPDACHAEIACKAAERGRHVLVEKPLATTLEECENMIAAAKQAGVLLMVDWHNRWNPPFYAARKAIRAGELGQVGYVYYRLSDTIYVPTKMLPWAGASSVMLFLGSHALDTTCWLLGKRPERVYCRRKEGLLTGRGITTADMYLTVVDFAGGAMAVIENSWVLPQCAPALIDHKCEITGAEGSISLDLTHHRASAKYTPATGGGYPDVSFADVLVLPEVHGLQRGFAVESINHFVECIRDGKPPLATGEDGLLNTRLILAAEESARTGKPVDVAS